jgi:tripartite-type tricarboxylate transporter receptor subunit TctC
MTRCLTRSFIHALFSLVLVALPVAAEEWPARSVKLIVPFGPGSTPDTVARLIADQLQQKLGQTFIVENKPGASGNLGTDAVAKAPPDGHTIGISIGGPLAINTLLFDRLPYDPKKDLALITMLATQPGAVAVHTSLGVHTIADLIDLLRREPGKYNFASIGNGSLSHLSMQAIAMKSGTQLVHIPYGSSPQAMTALLRGDVQITCLPAIAVTPQLGSGSVKILAVTTVERSTLLPDIPTLKEAGIDVEADAWMGLIAPAGTLDDTIAKIQHVVIESINRPAIKEKLAAQMMEPIGNSSAQFRARIDADIARWTPVIKGANIRIN